MGKKHYFLYINLLLITTDAPSSASLFAIANPILNKTLSVIVYHYKYHDRIMTYPSVDAVTMATFPFKLRRWLIADVDMVNADFVNNFDLKNKLWAFFNDNMMLF